MGLFFCSQVRAGLNVDEQRHYLFTPRDLTQWTRGLLRYELHQASHPLLEMWAFEGGRQLRDRLVSVKHTHKFDSIIASAMKSHFDYVSDSSGKVVFSSLMGSATDRPELDWGESREGCMNEMFKGGRDAVEAGEGGQEGARAVEEGRLE